MIDLRVGPEIQRELERIRQENPEGLLLPEEVVERSKDPLSPLHDHFGWTDQGAREILREGRIQIARQLIGKVRVHMIRPDESVVRVRKYLSLPQDRLHGGGYREVSSVMSDAAMRESYVASALRELQSFKKRFEKLRDVAGLWGSLTAAEESLSGASK